LRYDPDIVLIVALIKRINYKNIRLAVVTIQLRERTEDEMVPLVTERLSRNVAALHNSVANVLVQSGYTARKLYGNRRNELANMPNIPTTSCEEEASSKTSLLKIFAGDSASNCGLSRTGQAAQPEDASLVLSVSPPVYLSKKVDAGIREARGRVLLRV
jgi:hypothetical protein